MAARETLKRDRCFHSAGFSLIELLVALIVLMVIMGAALILMSGYLNTYGGEQLRDAQRDALRGAADLMTQEVGQAGYLGFQSSSLGGAVTVLGSQTVSIAASASTPYLFTGENLLVDAGTSEEAVTVTSVGAGTITAAFAKTHSAGAPVNVLGVFPTGVLSTTSGSTLDLYGDVNADGTLQFVEYSCNSAAQTLTRSITPITAASKNGGQVVLNNLVANPGGTACFQFQTATAAATGATLYVTNVTVTLTVQTAAPDPTTGAYHTLTYAFNLAPRDVLAALALAEINDTGRLQPAPPGLPLP